MTELAERRVTLVIGAGVSASASTDDGQRPPLWMDLLTDAAARCSVDDRGEIAKLVEAGRLLDAAQVIEHVLPPADFQAFMKEAFGRPRYRASAIHKLVERLDAPVVVTLNYDKIYDNYCAQDDRRRSYDVLKQYDSAESFVNGLRSDSRLIVKAHGCIGDPTRMVLTRRQYYEARRDYQGFYRVLDALLVTTTLLFLGCGFSGDPDIDLLLENAQIAVPGANPHYAVTPERHEALRATVRRTFNVELLEYPAGDHSQLEASLRELTELVDAERYRNR